LGQRVTTPKHNSPLHWFAIVVVVCSFGLIGMGGLVTSHGVGMAVPDWPTSYGYNMFALPISMWLTGGVFHEHSHRLWASALGVLVVALTRWIGGRRSRLPLAIIGGAEVIAGQSLLFLGDEWKGAGGFLSGIGGVVLLAALVWVRNEPASRPLPLLAWLAFWGVQLQGLLGGLRVVLDAHLFAGTKLGVWFGVFHGCLAQAFLVLVAVIALMTSRWWGRRLTLAAPDSIQVLAGSETGVPNRKLLLFTVALVFLQLLIGATMRHQHAGLAIPDFPKAYGAWWPDMSADAVARYNASRMELSAHNPITAFQIGLQMVHRLMAMAILLSVTTVFWQARKGELRTVCSAWLGLVLVQAGLGIWTIWSNKAADIATLHVLGGALTLMTGALIFVVQNTINQHTSNSFAECSVK
jgi:cytochrome c oxidase assembly protein subunit 15